MFRTLPGKDSDKSDDRFKAEDNSDEHYNQDNIPSR